MQKNAVGVWTASAGFGSAVWGATGSVAAAAVCGGVTALLGAVFLLVDVGSGG